MIGGTGIVDPHIFEYPATTTNPGHYGIECGFLFTLNTPDLSSPFHFKLNGQKINV